MAGKLHADPCKRLQGWLATTVAIACCWRAAGQGAAAPAPAQPLPAPADPATACTKEVFHNASVLCADIVWETPCKADPLCCERLSYFYGPDSPLPSRNCWCGSAWTELQQTVLISYVEYSTVFHGCTRIGYPVPHQSVSLNTSEPEGLCVGQALPAAEIEAPSMRSLGKWLRDLKHENFLLPSFIFMLISGIGVVLMAWPVVFDAVQECRSQLAKLRSVERRKGYKFIK